MIDDTNDETIDFLFSHNRLVECTLELRKAGFYVERCSKRDGSGPNEDVKVWIDVMPPDAQGRANGDLEDMRPSAVLAYISAPTNKVSFRLPRSERVGSAFVSDAIWEYQVHLTVTSQRHVREVVELTERALKLYKKERYPTLTHEPSWDAANRQTRWVPVD